MSRIIPPEDFDEYDWRLAESKGYLDDLGVELDDGRIVAVSFYDPVRLGQDIESEFSTGSIVVSWKRLLVVQKITPEVLQAAVDDLTVDFFN